MASVLCEYPLALPEIIYPHDYYEITKEQETPSSTTFVTKKDIPTPPPLSAGPIISIRNYQKRLSEFSMIPKDTRDLWDELFKTGYGADVFISTQHQLTVPAHLCVLSIASPVLGNCLQDSKPNNGVRHIKISGVPHGAVSTFIRFLYSSCYEEDDMKKFALHLLVLSHSFVVPRLKRVCVKYLENCYLTYENVIDVLQLARNCDAPRLSLICIRMVVRHFTKVAATDGWKVMRRVNPDLEQELLESVVEEGSRKGEKKRTGQERKVYLQLHEAVEALIHICNDGCTTIGPRDKSLKESQASCGFSACKGVETLIRHFFSCKVRGPGGCVHCKRMWQLLELHSRICDEPEESCHVPLCRHFKEKIRVQTKKDETKWGLLVLKIMEAKRAKGPFVWRNFSLS
ncbi:BTB/POZ and TAZ domain-containing protein 3 [Silene latifolia]|uniref:BTB/POZ and TAZ domain-containing protein 3 n=1 Tax=Silene latifolia TaxID=37657 RepID=UPI003D787EFB